MVYSFLLSICTTLPPHFLIRLHPITFTSVIPHSSPLLTTACDLITSNKKSTIHQPPSPPQKLKLPCYIRHGLQGVVAIRSRCRCASFTWRDQNHVNRSADCYQDREEWDGLSELPQFQKPVIYQEEWSLHLQVLGVRLYFETQINSNCHPGFCLEKIGNLNGVKVLLCATGPMVYPSRKISTVTSNPPFNAFNIFLPPIPRPTRYLCTPSARW